MSSRACLSFFLQVHGETINANPNCARTDTATVTSITLDTVNDDNDDICPEAGATRMHIVDDDDDAC